jgi:hypothetical protein
MQRLVARAFLWLMVLTLGACIPVRERNLELGTTSAEAKASLKRMGAHNKPLARPVVVLNGYHGFPTMANRIARKLRSATSGQPDHFLAVSYFFGTNIDAMTDQVIREVEAKWPCEDPEQTIEVDVVAISMGGVIARWAALAPDGRVRKGKAAKAFETRKRLRINRLLTLGTPHRGAVLAEWIRLDSAALDMRAGSGLLATLDEHWDRRDYELVCYAQMRDMICGATRCAPVGCVPIWTSGTLVFSHLDLPDNPIFLADIARRLRGEVPYLVPREGPPED